VEVLTEITKNVKDLEDENDKCMARIKDLEYENDSCMEKVKHLHKDDDKHMEIIKCLDKENQIYKAKEKFLICLVCLMCIKITSLTIDNNSTLSKNQKLYTIGCTTS
jgi:hypothetical protein